MINMTNSIYIQESEAASKDVCRLCSAKEELCDIFQAELKQRKQLRLTILLATGIEIKETDVVSKMVCCHCCEIAVKLHQYRINAIINDRILMDKCGQPYKPPIVNPEEILRLAARIANKDGNSPEYNGSSLSLNQSFYNDYQGTVTSLQSEKSCNDRNYQNGAGHIQKRLTDITITKVPSKSASPITSSGADDNELPIIIIPSTFGINVPKAQLLVDNAAALSYPGIITPCHDDLNKNVVDIGYHKENDSSKINIVRKSSILLTKNVTRKPRKKRGRKQKNPFVDDENEDEVIPKKKIRSLCSKRLRRVYKKVDLSTVLPNNEEQRKLVFMSSLELTPTEESMTATVPVSTALSSDLRVNSLVAISSSSPSVLNTTSKLSSKVNNRRKQILSDRKRASNSNNIQKAVENNKLTKPLETEVICLSDDSDDDDIIYVEADN